MKMESVQHLSIMAFVIHSLASSSYFTPFFQVFGFGFLEPQNEKKDKQKYIFLMRKKRKYFDAKCTCICLSWARVCLSYILGTKMKRYLVLEGLIKKIRCLRGLMKEWSVRARGLRVVKVHQAVITATGSIPVTVCNNRLIHATNIIIFIIFFLPVSMQVLLNSHLSSSFTLPF